jgi:hypothetical protein
MIGGILRSQEPGSLDLDLRRTMDGILDLSGEGPTFYLSGGMHAGGLHHHVLLGPTHHPMHPTA